MRPTRKLDFFRMTEHEPQLHRRPNLFNAWFVRLDNEKRNLLKSGRFRLLFLSFTILILLLFNLVGVVRPESALAQLLSDYVVWLHALEILLLIVLFWEIWREPLLTHDGFARLVSFDLCLEGRASSFFALAHQSVPILLDR